MNFNLNNEQLQRYSRNILIKEIGLEGQKKLLQSRVCVIGAGGLGSAALYYLAAAGIGELGIADSDSVDLSNLQRQVIHFSNDLNKIKTDSAKNKINSLNPDVRVNAYNIKVNSENIRQLINHYDFILDCTDNFKTKFLINDACFFENKPYSHAGVLSMAGQIMTIIPKKTACYRCIFNSPPESGSVNTSSHAGILGAVAGMFGTIQAIEAVKFITNSGRLLTDTLLTIDAGTFEIRKINIQKNTCCPLCGKKPSINKLKDEE
jgi:molybdopterin-synthase adenylyltransferase